jgi:hypothetical protein
MQMAGSNPGHFSAKPIVLAHFLPASAIAFAEGCDHAVITPGCDDSFSAGALSAGPSRNESTEKP